MYKHTGKYSALRATRTTQIKPRVGPSVHTEALALRPAVNQRCCRGHLATGSGSNMDAHDDGSSEPPRIKPSSCSNSPRAEGVHHGTANTRNSGAAEKPANETQELIVRAFYTTTRTEGHEPAGHQALFEVLNLLPGAHNREHTKP